MDPVLNQTTTTRTTYGQTPNTRDFNTWSDRELRKELKKYGEKLPRETERSQLLSRLQFFETNQTSGVSKTSGLTGTTGLPLQSQSVSNYPVQQTQSTIPITQPISNQTHSTIPSQTQHSTIPISNQSGVSTPSKTSGLTGTTGLPLQSQSVSNYPVQQTQSTIPNVLNQQIPIQQTNRDFNTWTEKEMRKELKKFGEKVPKDTQRAELIRRLAVHEKPAQTTTTQGTSLNPTTSLVQGSTKDHKDASDRDLRKELKKYGEKVPKDTERAELLRRLAVHEKSGSVNSQTVPTSQTVKTPTHTTTPVQNTNRDFNSWTEKEMRKELKKHGEKVSKDTDRAELIRRLNVHEKPVSSGTHHGKTHPESSKATIVTEDSKYYKDFSDRNLRKELKKKHGEKVPRHTDRAELIRRLAAYENPVPKVTSTNPTPTSTSSSHVKSTAPVTGSTHSVQQNQSGLSQQNQNIPSQQHNQSGLPQQNQNISSQQNQSGLSQHNQSGLSQQQNQHNQSGLSQHNQSGLPQQQNQSGFPQQNQSGLSQQNPSQQNQSGLSQQMNQQNVPSQQQQNQSGLSQQNQSGLPQQQQNQSGFPQQNPSQQNQSGLYQQMNQQNIPSQQQNQSGLSQQQNQSGLSQQNPPQQNQSGLSQQNQQNIPSQQQNQSGLSQQQTQSGFPQQNQSGLSQQNQQNIPQQSQLNSGSISQNTSTSVSNQQSVPQTQRSESKNYDNQKHN